MRRFYTLLSLALLAVATAGLWSLLLSAHPPHTLTLEAVAEEPLRRLMAAAGLAEPEPWDDSPAALMLRTKTSGCTVQGPYPDPACTPGAIFASTTVEQVCVSGYTKTVRHVPVKLKRQVYAQYGIGYPPPTGSYEADHLIPLALGGSNDIANLFPESAEPKPGFKEKDLVENYLHQQVCDGRMPLPRAQEQIARDWVAVYRSLSAADLARLREKYRSWADRDID